MRGFLQHLKYSLILLLGITFSAFAQPWQQSESILKYDEQITVNRDASIDVVETITVFANQQQIIHGLRRDFPVKYKDSYGISHHTDYQIKRILVNNVSSPYFTKRENNNLIVYIGDKDTVLPTGEYTYTISYHVDDAVNFLKDADELYWNITGNAWSFPIQGTTATIILPQGATAKLYTAYTGPIGARGKDFTITSAQNIVQVQTIQPLKPGEGLTVAISWPKGFVVQPTWQDKVKRNIASLDASEYLIVEICLAVLCYYLFVWYSVGRDPRKGPIVPLFEPPDNLTATAVRYISRMGFDMILMSVGVVALAAKGFLTISDQNGQFTLLKKENITNNLAEEERTFANALFASGDIVELSNDNKQTITSAISALSKKLKQLYQKKYFVLNRIYLVPGILLSLLGFAIAISAAGDQAGALSALFTMVIWSLIFFFLLKRMFVRVYSFASNTSFGSLISSVGSGIVAVFLVFVAIYCIDILTVYFPMFTVPFLVLLAVLNLSFYYLLRRYTVEGRKIADQIEGFKMFLCATEKYKLEQWAKIEKTPALFEKYLPYAIALNVEKFWAQQFAEVFARAQESGQEYQPSWYMGSRWNSESVNAFPGLLAAGIASSLSSVESSGSASGGGGSSGGGGGGGGGGGW